jgi:hypothetical protein
MTGYGRGETILDDRRLTVEIKSINNRFCDIQVRQSRVLQPLETRTRELIGRRLSRGKIDVSINFEDNSESAYAVHCDLAWPKPMPAPCARSARPLPARNQFRPARLHVSMMSCASSQPGLIRKVSGSCWKPLWSKP